MERRPLGGLLEGAARHHPGILGPFRGAESGMRSGSEIRARLDGLGSALSEFGMASRSRVAVIAPVGGNSVLVSLAVTAGGGVPVLIDPTLDDGSWRRALLETEATHAVVSGADPLDRLVALRPDLPSLELVLVCDSPDEDRRSPAMTVDEAIARASRSADIEGGSGTPRREVHGTDATALGVVAVGGAVAWTARSDLSRAVEAISKTLQLRSDDVVLARPAALGAVLMAIAAACFERAVPMIADDGSEPLAAVLPRIRPTVAIVSTDDLDSARRAIADEVACRPALVRRAHAWALERGRHRSRGGVALRIAEAISLKGTRDRLGGRLRLLAIDGVAQEPPSADFFTALGLDVQPLSSP